MDTVSEFHAEAPQATASEELAQGIYVVARAGFEPTTLRVPYFLSCLPCSFLLLLSSPFHASSILFVRSVLCYYTAYFMSSFLILPCFTDKTMIYFNGGRNISHHPILAICKGNNLLSRQPDHRPQTPRQRKSIPTQAPQTIAYTNTHEDAQTQTHTIFRVF